MNSLGFIVKRKNHFCLLSVLCSICKLISNFFCSSTHSVGLLCLLPNLYCMLLLATQKWFSHFDCCSSTLLTLTRLTVSKFLVWELFVLRMKLAVGINTCVPSSYITYTLPEFHILWSYFLVKTEINWCSKSGRISSFNWPDLMVLMSLPQSVITCHIEGDKNRCVSMWVIEQCGRKMCDNSWENVVCSQLGPTAVLFQVQEGSVFCLAAKINPP